MSAGDLARVENPRVDIAGIEIVLCACGVAKEVRIGRELTALGDDHDFIARDGFFANGASERLSDRAFARLHSIRESGVEDISRPLEEIANDASVEKIIDSARIPSQRAEGDRREPEVVRTGKMIFYAALPLRESSGAQAGRPAGKGNRSLFGTGRIGRHGAGG